MLEVAHDLARESEAGREHAGNGLTTWRDEPRRAVKPGGACRGVGGGVRRAWPKSRRAAGMVRQEIRAADQAVQPRDEPGRDQGRPAVRRAHDQGRSASDGSRRPQGGRHQEVRRREVARQESRTGEEGAPPRRRLLPRGAAKKRRECGAKKACAGQEACSCQEGGAGQEGSACQEGRRQKAPAGRRARQDGDAGKAPATRNPSRAAVERDIALAGWRRAPGTARMAV